MIKSKEKLISMLGQTRLIIAKILKVYQRHRFKLIDDCGQMMVELCIVFPVVIAVAFITFNALAFFEDCARFDRAVHNSVRIASSTPNFTLENFYYIGEDVLLELESEIDDENADLNMDFFVTEENYMTYEVEMAYHPTFFGISMRQEVFGVSLPSLNHKIEFTVDPYRASVFL